jgi:hypothetical protein
VHAPRVSKADLLRLVLVIDAVDSGPAPRARTGPAAPRTRRCRVPPQTGRPAEGKEDPGHETRGGIYHRVFHFDMELSPLAATHVDGTLARMRWSSGPGLQLRTPIAVHGPRWSTGPEAVTVPPVGGLPPV